LKALQQSHRLAVERRDAVLSEPVCRRHRDAWSAYRKRAGALAELARRFAPGRLDRAALRTIVQRFGLEDSGMLPSGAPMHEILNWLRALAGANLSDQEPS